MAEPRPRSRMTAIWPPIFGIEGLQRVESRRPLAQTLLPKERPRSSNLIHVTDLMPTWRCVGRPLSLVGVSQTLLTTNMML